MPSLPSSPCSCPETSASLPPSITPWRRWSTWSCHTSRRNTKTTWMLLETPTTAWRSSSRSGPALAAFCHLFPGVFSKVCFCPPVAMFQPDGQRVRVQTNQQLHELFHAWRPKGSPAVTQKLFGIRTPAGVSLSSLCLFFMFTSRHCLSSSLSSCVLSATMSTTSLWTCPCRLQRGGSWDFKVGGSVQSWWGLLGYTVDNAKTKWIPCQRLQVFTEIHACKSYYISNNQPFFCGMCLFFP